MTPVPRPCSDPAHAELAAELATLRRKLADAERRVLKKDERILCSQAASTAGLRT